jgi:acetyl esterase/lipase
MASPEYEQLRKVLKPGLAIPSDPPELVREKMHRIHPTKYPDDVKVHHAIHAGVDAASVETPESAPQVARSEPKASEGHQAATRVLLHVHGGAFVSTGVEHYIPYAAHLSRALRARVVVFGYRLAPEHRYPAALDDTLAVYRAVLDAGTPPDRIAIGGDSCGGGIGIALLLRLRAAGLPLPAAFVGLTGWYDLEMTGDSARHPRGVDPYVDPEWIRARGRDYAGPNGNVRDPLLSPIHADLSGLPPMFLSCGEIDITRDDSTRLAARAGRDGVAVTLEVNPEMIHGFHGLAAIIPEGRAALERAGEFVRRHIP